MTYELVIDFFSHLVSLFLLPIAFLMCFQLVRKWLS